MDVDTCGIGMRDAILDAGTNFVVPLLNWMRYCGEVVGSIGMSMTVPDQRMALLLGLGSTIQVPGGKGLLMEETFP